MGKRKYYMYQAAEDGFNTYIEMTKEEAEIVNRVLSELGSKNNVSYTGSCGICLDDYIEIDE